MENEIKIGLIFKHLILVFQHALLFKIYLFLKIFSLFGNFFVLEDFFFVIGLTSSGLELDFDIFLKYYCDLTVSTFQNRKIFWTYFKIQGPRERPNEKPEVKFELLFKISLITCAIYMKWNCSLFGLKTHYFRNLGCD